MSVAQLLPPPPVKTPIDADGKVALIRYWTQWFQQIPALLTITLVSPPATASSQGSPGQVAIDAGYLYACVAQNTWKRVALVTW